MPLNSRLDMYNKVVVNGNVEVDYLSGEYHNMNLGTINYEKITAMTLNRIDLVSFKHYRNYHYGWLILEHNGIIDPMEELDIGMQLKIPSLEDYFRFKNRYKRSG